VAVDLDEVSAWILAVDHAVWLLAGLVVADGHALPASGGNDLCCQPFDVRVLDAEVEDAGFPVLEIVLGRRERTALGLVETLSSTENES
jgi:hypothetical protein